MKFDPRGWVGPLIAVVILVLTVQQTLSALQLTGAWRKGSGVARARTEDPYSRIENLLSQRPTQTTYADLRSPFGYATIRPPEQAPVQRPDRPRLIPTPTAPPRPVLTAIVWSGSDPRATIRYDGRDFSVRENSLFADFTVRSITRTNVVLERNTGETLTLTLRVRGE